MQRSADHYRRSLSQIIFIVQKMSIIAVECFPTGTTAEVIGATKLDNREIGDGKVGPVTRKWMSLFATEVRK